ncbi:MAG: HEAT repeat domain-containing protein [Verrucomicrobiales bacterium]|nr:HEAT repeat domain-containing protein [Verrucomicrobiales bacterium]
MMKAYVVRALRGALFFAVPFLALSPDLKAAEESFGNAPQTGGNVMPASREGEMAIKKFRVAPGLQTELWAAEPLVANIVAFNFDDQGNCYVVETFRHSAGVTDIRGHMGWLDEELASRSVDDRIAIIKKHEAGRLDWYTKYSDRVRKVWDSKGQGYADQATVFSDGYNAIEDGLASGVLAWKGRVYFANIPHLWELRDANGDGVAEGKNSLLHGFGVRTGFLGHDLHGLIVGPDGRLYFTVGDRGGHVVTADGRTISNPETGAVYRCNPDGSGLEIFAQGLRNPQEIAFDDLGNWFTGDNNSDGGDPARWVYLLEGGDSGWHIGYQFIDKPNSRGPWISEKMCYPPSPEQPAYLIPPVANITSGPSGLAHYPGTGLPERYQGHFFLVDFTGGKGSSVHSFAVKPKGAGFELVDRDHLISDLLATDVEFGPDGGVYVSDWVQGWDKTGKGRIYRISDPNQKDNPLLKETKQLIGEDLSLRPVSDLVPLLGHQDQRVRLRSQFALADKGTAGEVALRDAARQGDRLLARVHGIWGLGQVLRQRNNDAPSRASLDALLALLNDSDREVAAQAAKCLGEVSWKPAAGKLAEMLNDPLPRNRLLAGIALAKLQVPASASAFLKLARDNESARDPYLRHAAVLGLAGIREEAPLLAAAADPSSEVRTTAVLGLRRLKSPSISRFLRDADPRVAVEAGRAVHDLPIDQAMPDLASIELTSETSTPLGRRVVDAQLRVGTAEAAERLVRIATNSTLGAAIRVQAIQSLAKWGEPTRRDAITGLWRPLPARVATQAITGLSPHLPSLIKSGSSEVQVESARLSAAWKQTDTGASLLELLSNTTAGIEPRREALKALADLKDARLNQAIEIAKADAAEGLKREATRLQGESGGQDALRTIEASLEKGTRGEQQAAASALGGLKDGASEQVLARWIDRLTEGKVPAYLHLDLLESAGKRSSPALKDRLATYEASRSKTDKIAAYRECLEGGDAALGKKIFIERADVSCVRCHKVGAEGGEVGPDLTGIGSRQARNYILESIVAPNEKIAAGFETVLVTLKDGSAYAGQVKLDTETELEINSPEDGIVKVKKSDITSRERGLSGMPEELRQMLSKQDLRNLVEFLSQSK